MVLQTFLKSVLIIDRYGLNHTFILAESVVLVDALKSLWNPRRIAFLQPSILERMRR